MKITRNILSLDIICLLLISANGVFAETAGTGALTGTVIDSSRAVVPEAQVKVSNEATGETRTIVTKDNCIEISKQCFKSAVKTGMCINITETAKPDVQLEVGEISATVNITADAELLQTETASLLRV